MPISSPTNNDDDNDNHHPDEEGGKDKTMQIGNTRDKDSTARNKVGMGEPPPAAADANNNNNNSEHQAEPAFDPAAAAPWLAPAHGFTLEALRADALYVFLSVCLSVCLSVRLPHIFFLSV